jgi:hypothetical protein
MLGFGVVDVLFHIFFTRALAGGVWSASPPPPPPRRFTPRESAPGTHWIRGWVNPRASVDDVEKRKFLTLPGLEIQPQLSSP